MAKQAGRFQRGSGCYKCESCGKLTRATRGDNEHVRLCVTCYDKAGDENAVADGLMTQAEFDAKWPTPMTSEQAVSAIQAALKVSEVKAYQLYSQAIEDQDFDPAVGEPDNESAVDYAINSYRRTK